ncbi:MAG: VanZ family protein, partial [Clostridia bacterium]|nr:VanZ family protein [Clostridia bacterium]
SVGNHFPRGNQRNIRGIPGGNNAVCRVTVLTPVKEFVSCPHGHFRRISFGRKKGNLGFQAAIPQIIGGDVGFFLFFLPFFLILSLSIVAVEIAQLLFRVGSLDVDDYILNAIGAVAVFLLLKTKPGRALTSKIYREAQNTDKDEK